MIEIYSKSNCVFCEKAKQLLSTRGQSYTEIDLMQEGAKDRMFERFEKQSLPLPRTVPQIFIDGEYIGGYDQLKARDIPSK